LFLDRKKDPFKWKMLKITFPIDKLPNDVEFEFRNT